MKTYFVAGRYYGTQAEAKKIDKNFAEIEVPTDKPGLLAFLNERPRLVEEVCTPVVARQDPPADEAEKWAELGTRDAKTFLNYTNEFFPGLPVETQLTLAVNALDNAQAEIARLRGLQPGGIATPARVQLADTDGTWPINAAPEDVAVEEEIDPFA